MPSASTLQELFLTHLQDIYHGEKQILKASPQNGQERDHP